MTEKIPVLLFGDHIAAYGAIRGLAAEQIPIYIVSRKGEGIATKSRFVKKTFALEALEDGFVEGLKRIGEEVGGEAVVMVAGDDVYLDLLSQNISQLPDGFRCTFHGWDVVSTVRQKHITYQKCAEIGVGFPKTCFVSSREQLESALSELDIEFPILLKAEDSRRFVKKYNTKGIIAQSREEVLKIYDDHEEFFGGLLVSEYIPGGEEQLINLIAAGDRQGNAIEVFMNRKVRSSGQFLGCTLMENYYSKQLLEDSLKLMSHLNYYGYCNPEFKVDPRDGSLRLMEINGRITLSVSHGIRCGFNLPYAMYRCAMGQRNDEPHIYHNNPSERILWWDPMSDFFSCLHSFKQGKFSLRQYIKSLRADGRIIELFWLKDPKVGFVSIMRLISKIVRTIRRRVCRR